MVAVDDTLHFEGLWPGQRRFKLFVYDADMRPLPPDRLAGIKGRVLIGERQFALVPSAKGFLEARIPPLTIPAVLTVQIGSEAFRFVFAGYSVESEPFSFILPPTPIPGTLRELLAALQQDSRDAQSLFDGRNFTMGYVPAVHAHDRLLALEPYVRRLPEDRRAPAEAATLAGLRAAWLLHVISDNALFPFQIGPALQAMRKALDDVIVAFGRSAR
jgi:hypothetical protein